MIDESPLPSQGEIDTQILRALVRKLMVKGILSQDDLRTLLLEAVTRLDDRAQPGAPDGPSHG